MFNGMLDFGKGQNEIGMDKSLYSFILTPQGHKTQQRGKYHGIATIKVKK